MLKLRFSYSYKCFDLYLLNHHITIANGVFIRDLYYIVVDDQDLTNTELTFMRLMLVLERCKNRATRLLGGFGRHAPMEIF